MRAWALVAAVVVVVGCGKGGGAGGAGVVAKLPAGSGLVMGMTRGVSEAEMLDAVKAARPAFESNGVPACAVDTFAKVDQAAIAVSEAEPKSVAVVHGVGLRVALEACLTSQHAVIAEDGGVTHYQLDGGSLYGVWLDADTLLTAPDNDAATNAALRAAPTLSASDPVTQLAAKVEATGFIWLAADVSKLGAKIKGVLPAGITVTQVWAQISGKDVGVDASIETGAPDQATKLVTMLTALMARYVPDGAQVMSKMTTIKADGARVTIHADVGLMLRQTMGAQGDSSAAIIGVLAAVAVPAFMKNARKAKTIEATVNVKKMFDGARVYYEEGAKKFPPSVGPTPPLGACCTQPGHKCAPDPTLWTDPSWQALRFSMDDPSRYSYQLTSSADGFTVAAYGDLNCDGVYSTFEMAGKIAADGSITGGAGLFKDKELE